MHMINDKGEAVYFNPIRKNGKDQWLIQGIGSTIVLGRDRQRRKSRTFTQYSQAELDGKVNFLIKVLKYIIAESGFELLARIELRDKRTGRCFR